MSIEVEPPASARPTGPAVAPAREPQLGSDGRGLIAILVACGVIAGALLVSGLVVSSLRQLAAPETPSYAATMLASLLAVQASVIVLTLLAALAFGRFPAGLSPRWPAAGLAELVPVIAVMVVVLGLYTLGAMTLFRDLVMRDLAHFQPLLKPELMLAAFLALVIGAPLSEELLFRGFLLGELRHTRLGFVGASIVSTLCWSALHWGYSPVGLIEVTIAGLIFSWALWRSESVWIPVICHALYNGCVLIVLWMVLPAT